MRIMSNGTDNGNMHAVKKHRRFFSSHLETSAAISIPPHPHRQSHGNHHQRVDSAGLDILSAVADASQDELASAVVGSPDSGTAGTASLSSQSFISYQSHAPLEGVHARDSSLNSISFSSMGSVDFQNNMQRIIHNSSPTNQLQRQYCNRRPSPVSFDSRGAPLRAFQSSPREADTSQISQKRSPPKGENRGAFGTVQDAYQDKNCSKSSVGQGDVYNHGINLPHLQHRNSAFSSLVNASSLESGPGIPIGARHGDRAYTSHPQRPYTREEFVYHERMFPGGRAPLPTTKGLERDLRSTHLESKGEHDTPRSSHGILRNKLVGSPSKSRDASPNPSICLTSNNSAKRMRRKCTIPNCTNRVVQGGLCITHGAKRKTCSYEGCNKNVKKAGLCSTHGPARKRCEVEGCNKVSVQGGRCISHGAKKKMCCVENCTKQSITNGMCKKHSDEQKDNPPPRSGRRKHENFESSFNEQHKGLARKRTPNNDCTSMGESSQSHLATSSVRQQDGTSLSKFHDMNAIDAFICDENLETTVEKTIL